MGRVTSPLTLWKAGALSVLAVTAAACTDSTSRVAPATNPPGQTLPAPTDVLSSIAVGTLPAVTVVLPQQPAQPVSSTKPRPSSSSTAATKPAKHSTTTTTAAATTTTAPAPASAWTPMSLDSIQGPVAVPCCAENYHGTASPPLPAAGAALADGTYVVEGRFRKVPSKPLQLTVFRLEECAKIPTSCEDFGSDATALGIDRSASLALTLPLDKKLHVVFTGFDGTSNSAVAVSGTGADLAALATALHDSYQKVIGNRIAKGENPDKVLADVAAHPRGGWSAAPEGSGVLMFSSGSLPKVLLQVAPQTNNGTDLLGLIAVHVEGGVITLNTYAGFYS